MSPKPLHVLGLMSGTSADGIEATLARVSGAPLRLNAELLAHASLPFPAGVRAEILRVAEQKPINAGTLSQLNFRLGEIFADAALAACKKFRVSPRKVDLIGSHGQTIFHQGSPARYLGATTTSTLQIGEAAIIAARTGINTVADFRPADMAVGGQGAPLVPYADFLLYRHPKLGRVSLNLGGIANVTAIPPAAKPTQVRAFDTGPANILIDALVAHFTKGRQRFDRGAAMALQSRALPVLLDELLHEPYLRIPPPKSTGREYFGRAYVEKILDAGRRLHLKRVDVIRDVTLFTALSVADALNHFVVPQMQLDQLIVSGGGAFNPLIMAQLREAFPAVDVFGSARLGIPENAKEAYAFALLAYETWHQRPGNLLSATGARRPAILGKISYAPPR